MARWSSECNNIKRSVVRGCEMRKIACDGRNCANVRFRTNCNFAIHLLACADGRLIPLLLENVESIGSEVANANRTNNNNNNYHYNKTITGILGTRTLQLIFRCRGND